jgi:class 3 adenylate cyclase
VGFTALSSELSPQELVTEIDHYYRTFDDITHKYGIEKIKTIGDSYMCASGLPVEKGTHAEDAVSAAIEMRDFVEMAKEERKKQGRPFFEIRIGLNSGPVIAGIVGVKKFSYDVWGDTVNVASRMESKSMAGKINISQSTYELVKDKFDCSYRGKLDAKNKGLIDMYFVEPRS